VPRRLTKHLQLLLAAALVGVATAFGVWGFKTAIAGFEWLAFGWAGDGWSDVPWPLVVVVPILGGLVVGVTLHLARIPDEPGHGVTEVIEAVKLDVQDVPYRRTTVKAPLAALSIGTGASLGPEDPAVEIGGSIGEWLAKRWRRSHDIVQSLTAAGAAAGISAAFHAPAAAIVFSAEVFGVRPLSRRMGLVVVASLSAFAAMFLVAPETVLRIPAQEWANGWMLGYGLLLGILAGVIASQHVRLTYLIEHRFLQWQTPPRWLKPAMGGALLGIGGMIVPELMGVGYGTTQDIIGGLRMNLGVLAVLMIGKLAFMALSFGSGFLGGFFAPSLFAGAALGGLFGLAVTTATPGLGVVPGPFVMAGMAALLAGLVHAPLTAVLLLAAVSADYSLTPLLLIASMTSYWVSKGITPDSLYTYAFAHPARVSNDEEEIEAIDEQG